MDDEHIALTEELMVGFARRTGLLPESAEPRRYLWTDAFAVCNFLEIYRLTGEGRYLDLGLRLVDQVHAILGRHRRDDRRKGWISGLSSEEGQRHPTAGGLCIGKRWNERAPDEPIDPREEWDRDGQYLHYLTKWMHALVLVSEVTSESRFLAWAAELAQASRRFAYTAPGDGRRLYWKMSIDLSRPLVTSMGQHDALDALITYRELRLAERALPDAGLANLAEAIEDTGSMIRSSSWVTDDPLGAGSLLVDAWRTAVLGDADLLRRVAAAAAVSLQEVGAMDPGAPATGRLAFRELGLSIGLHAAELLPTPGEPGALADRFEKLRGHAPLGREIEAFWSDPANRANALWKEHGDINSVMLATSLAPGGFLRLWAPGTTSEAGPER